MAKCSTPTTPSPSYERVPHVVRRTGIARTTIYDLCASGRLPSVKLGRVVLIPSGAVEDLIAEETARQRGRLPIDLTSRPASA